MPARSLAPTPRTVQFQKDRATEIAVGHGLTSKTDQAAFFNVSRSVWSRVLRNKARVGEEFIAAVLTSDAARKYPDQVTFDGLFKVAA